jgi:hypothetical protein
VAGAASRRSRANEVGLQRATCFMSA